MAQATKEPCKKEACDIQACLTKNNFLPQKCLKVIELLQSCCEKCEYKSTHCASVSGLLKQKPKMKTLDAVIEILELALLIGEADSKLNAVLDWRGGENSSIILSFQQTS